MLRMVLNARRHTLDLTDSALSASSEPQDDESESTHLEPWADFLRRTARWTEQQLEDAGLSQWIVKWRKTKWMWAAKLFGAGADKWSTKATVWQPLLHSSAPRGRRQARPKKRWEQDFVDYLAEVHPQLDKHWHDLAKDTEWWHAEADRYYTS